MASEFLLAYRDLVRLARNDPSDLSSRANDDAQLQEACDRVSGAHLRLWIAERYSTELYAQHIPSREIAARREYEKRWQRAVAATDRLLGSLLLDGGPLENFPADADREIEDAAEAGRFAADQFDTLMEYTRNVADTDDVGDFSEWALPAIRVWDDLHLRTGFHLHTVMARLELVPFILIPSDISQSRGSAETISLFQRLKDAQRAFIFGCDLACAALQRSILEDVLRRNYQTEGTLHKMIETANLPWGLTARELVSIKDLGNDVLHADRSGPMDRRDLIKRLVAGLRALQKLIEGAPIALTKGKQ